MFKRRMVHLRERHWWGRQARARPRGQGSRARGDPRARARCRPASSRARRRCMWNWKPEKRILEDLFAAGELVVAGRDGFQRLYDLPERVIPARYLDAPTRAGGVRSWVWVPRGRGPGRLTEAGIAEHCRFRGGARRCGRCRRARRGGARAARRVEDGGCLSSSRPAPRSTARRRAACSLPVRQPAVGPAVHRARVRLRPLIEVYKREHERIYGYYVLPFVYGDRLVGRADLKSDREAGVLRVKALHPEAGVRWTRRWRSRSSAPRRGSRGRSTSNGSSVSRACPGERDHEVRVTTRRR